MSIVVKGPGPKQATIENADDMDVDDIGTLVLTRGDGRQEEVVALFANGAWASAEKR